MRSIKAHVWRAVKWKMSPTQFRNASCHFLKPSAAGAWTKIIARVRSHPLRAERKPGWNLLVLNLVLGLAWRAASTAALDRLRTTPRIIPDTKAEVGGHPTASRRFAPTVAPLQDGRPLF